MAQKPSIPKGTRDFSPEEMAKRNYIFDTIKSVFKTYGFQPIETPAMENLSTLLGKYGEEGDKLLFKILNSGDFTSGADASEFCTDRANALSTKICEKGLRYDLTVPFARFVVQHQNELTFPFKRYQIQPVWRADRPQKGRYREFFQCDADVIGSKSLLNEVELVQIIDAVFNKLDINVLIKINNRKILSGIAEVIGHPDKLIDITVAIDKIDKIGLEAVNAELEERGISRQAIEQLRPIITLSGTTESKISMLRGVLAISEIGIKGVDEVATILEYLKSVDVKQEVELDLSLARGLNYYTGAIFEVKSKDTQIGSICGGGRYDDLTGIFGLKDVSGVGISFGADRIYDVLNTLDKYPKDSTVGTQLLFVNFGKAEELFCLPILATLRSNGIAAEIYPESAKMKKQMEYANKRSIPFVAIVGENEIQNGAVSLKNMITGEQKVVAVDEIIAQLSI